MIKKEIVMLHYRPLEEYPPVMNAIRYLAEDDRIALTVVSTWHTGPRKAFEHNNVRLNRVKSPHKDQPLPLRLWMYWQYNLRALALLIRKKPEAVICYESTSSWPTYMYLIRLRNKARLFFHYHEYASRQEYQKLMWLERHNQPREEKYLLNKCIWISHTNQERLNLYHKEYPSLSSEHLRVLPNYPPKSWLTSANSEGGRKTGVVKLVCIGSLSFENTYLKEVVEWVAANPTSVSLSIYSYNIKKDAKEYLAAATQCFANIRSFETGVDYDSIPTLLPQFHVGLILYRNYSANVMYCAPNKLFEYLVGGLQVWYSQELEGCRKVAGEIGEDKVVAVNFDDLRNFKVDDLQLNTSGGSIDYFTAENALYPLKKLIFE